MGKPSEEWDKWLEEVCKSLEHIQEIDHRNLTQKEYRILQSIYQEALKQAKTAKNDEIVDIWGNVLHAGKEALGRLRGIDVSWEELMENYRKPNN